MTLTQNVVQYPPNCMTYAPAKLKVATSKSLGRRCIYKKVHHMTLTLGSKSQNVAPYPPQIATFAPAKFEVAMSNGLGVDASTRKYIP